MSTLENLRSRLEASIALRSKATKGKWMRGSIPWKVWADGGRIALFDSLHENANSDFVCDAANHPYAEALLALVNEVAESPHGSSCDLLQPTPLDRNMPKPVCNCWKSSAIARAAGVLNAKSEEC